MSQPANDILFVYECPYCAGKLKYLTHEDYHYEARDAGYSPSISFCPHCRLAIFFRDRPLPLYSKRNSDESKSKVRNSSYEAHLVECVRDYLPSPAFKPEWLVVPSLSKENGRSIIESTRYKPEAEAAIRLKIWDDDINSLLSRDKTTNRTRAFHDLILWAKRQFMENRKEKERKEPRKNYDLNKIESLLDHWKANQSTFDLYQRFEKVLIQEADRLLALLRSSAIEELIYALKNRILEFHKIVSIAHQICWRASVREPRHPEQERAYLSFLENLKKTENRFVSAILEMTSAQSDGTLEFSKEIKRSTWQRTRLYRANLERLVTLQEFQSPMYDFDRLKAYQQLGRFAEARAMLDQIASSLEGAADPYWSTYIRELQKRIKQRNNRPFVLKNSYLVRD